MSTPQHALSKLHRNIRLTNWEATLKMVEQDHSERKSFDNSSVIYDVNSTIVPLLLQENSIGWTAIHFSALHGAPNMSWWKWMLTMVIEEHNRYLERMRCIDNVGKYYDYVCNPFFRRTQAGHSATDLFFSKRLHPFPFETLDVRRDAQLLKEGISVILEFDDEGDTRQGAVLAELRRRIQEKMDGERLRQRQHGTMPKSMFLGSDDVMHHTSDGDEDQIAVPVEVDGLAELEHEMSVHEHVHIEVQDHTGELDAETGWSIMNEDILNQIVHFWHEMELLVMAATKLSLRMVYNSDENGEEQEEFQDWSILHGLARVGCPIEIGRLAVKLYPDQVHQIDINENLPLHVASQSHITSALAAGTWNHCQSCEENTATVPPMMRCLLEVHPGGALEVNSDGRHPINLAILAGKTWVDGIKDLFLACPSVTINGSLDSILHLPSFMIAALPRGHTIDSNDEEQKFDESEQWYRMNASNAFEEEMRAKRRASKTIGSMWRFLPHHSKLQALAEARSDIDVIQLSTIFELLRINPGLICSLSEDFFRTTQSSKL